MLKVFLKSLLLVIKLVEVYNVKNIIMMLVDIIFILVLDWLKCFVKNLGMVSELLVILVYICSFGVIR